MADPTITPVQALDIWTGSSPHHDVILNRGIWQNYTWRAVGAVAGARFA